MSGSRFRELPGGCEAVRRRQEIAPEQEAETLEVGCPGWPAVIGAGIVGCRERPLRRQAEWYRGEEPDFRPSSLVSKTGDEGLFVSREQF